MTQPEQKVINAIRSYVLAHGGLCYKLHQDGYGTRGLPDLLVILDGQTLLVETKQPGHRPEPHQTARIDEINQHGGKAFWCDSLDGFIRQL